MPRAKVATTVAAAPKTRRAVAAAPAPVERKRTPVRRKVSTTIPAFDVAAHCDEIAHMAYLNWLGREGGVGNPEEDWFLAEQSVRAKYAA